MKLTDPPGAGWLCPTCKRRVPPRLTDCRCGRVRQDVYSGQQDTDSSSERGTTGVTSLAIAVVFVLAVAGAAMWLKPARPASPATLSPAATAQATPDAARFAVTTPPMAQPVSDVRPPAPPAIDPVRATPPAPAALEDIISAALPAVVVVESSAGRGTGFFVSSDTLLTNVHVVAGNGSVTIRQSNGTTGPARVAMISSDYDIAVLKVANPDSNQVTIPLGSAFDARVGQEVIAIGSPLGTLQNTVTRGIVSAVRQSGGATLVQTDAAINPGNSGGPLLDRTGHVIAITTLGYVGRQGLGFAVAVDHARALLEGRALPAQGRGANDTDLRGLSPAQSSAAQPSPVDQARATAGQALDKTVAQLAQRAETLDRNWSSFKRVCYAGKVAGGFDHEWFAFFDQRAMQGQVVPGCDLAFSDLRRDADDIRGGVAAADETARQSDVFPGDRRDVLRKYRLDALAR